MIQHFLRFMALSAAVSSIAGAADEALIQEVRLLFSTGVWDRAVQILEKSPASQSDPEVRQLLAMAYLYTSNRPESMANLAKAESASKSLVDTAGARFLVNMARDSKKKDKFLVEATPGELVINKSVIEFFPRLGPVGEVPKATASWRRSEAGCSPSTEYGSSTNSFLIQTGQGRSRTETYFRPWHNSPQETRIICALIGGAMVQASGGSEEAAASAAPSTAPAAQEKDKDNKKKTKKK